MHAMLDLGKPIVTGIGSECKPEKCSPFSSLEIVNIVNCVQLREKCFGKLCKFWVEERWIVFASQGKSSQAYMFRYSEHKNFSVDKSASQCKMFP